jgi:hypothetical protein
VRRHNKMPVPKGCAVYRRETRKTGNVGHVVMETSSKYRRGTAPGATETRDGMPDPAFPEKMPSELRCTLHHQL